MAVLPIQSTTGDPIFRSQNTSINAIKRFSRVAADASVKLNSQERIVSPGDDALSFSTSRRIRTEINALKIVSETGQLNITGLGLAVEALDGIKGQLDAIKQKIVQAQVADPSELDSIQAEIDLALAQVDSTANNTKLGSRSLLNGSSTINAYFSVAANGQITDFSFFNNAASVASTPGIQRVTVHKIGAGGATRKLTDGTAVLSMTVQLHSANKGTRAFLGFTAGAAATTFAEFRITGKLGSATIRISSTAASLSQLGGTANAFNMLADQTGVILTSGGTATRMGLTTLGYGSDEFIKVELISSSNAGTLAFGSVTSADAAGTAQTDYGTATSATINGQLVELGGEFGTTARYLSNGFDIEIDFGTRDLSSTTVTTTTRLNIELDSGISGLLGTTGRTGDLIQYGYGNMTTENLGRGAIVNTVTVASTGRAKFTTANTSLGNQVLGGASVAEIGSGGRFALNNGKFKEGLATIDRAIDQVINEQTRLGSIQGNFIDSVNRAEVGVGNLSAADADIIGADAVSEITNLIQAQLGISTASSVLSQANAIQANVFSLLRG